MLPDLPYFLLPVEVKWCLLLKNFVEMSLLLPDFNLNFKNYLEEEIMAIYCV